MKLMSLLGNIFMLLVAVFTTAMAVILECRWVMDASMQHTGIKYAGGVFCFVCLLLVAVSANELVQTIKNKE